MFLSIESRVTLFPFSLTKVLHVTYSSLIRLDSVISPLSACLMETNGLSFSLGSSSLFCENACFMTFNDRAWVVNVKVHLSDKKFLVLIVVQYYRCIVFV